MEAEATRNDAGVAQPSLARRIRRVRGHETDARAPGPDGHQRHTRGCNRRRTMILHFDQALVRQPLAHSQAAPARRAAFDQADPAGPGLWLVGDSGVYLMSNGLPGLLRQPGTSRQFVCHAIEADPDALGYERADDAKRVSFGGDDGVEFIDAATCSPCSRATSPPN